jgi:hypothetical protein
VCSSGIGFDPVVDGERYTFEVAGLYNGVFVMKDRQTGSIWTHYDGTVLTGPLAGGDTRLTIIPLVHATWEEWVASYPDSLVLDWYPEFAARYRARLDEGEPGIGPGFQRTILNWDDRLPENELVLGVETTSESRAYVLAELPAEPAVLADGVGDTPVVVFSDGAGFALAYSPILEGETLTFSVDGGAWVDQSATVWDRTGLALSGPNAGKRLGFITSFVTEWYGWAAYHPETSIYGR